MRIASATRKEAAEVNYGLCDLTRLGLAGTGGIWLTRAESVFSVRFIGSFLTRGVG